MVTECPTGTLQGASGDLVTYHPARCARWRCDDCGPRKARKLAARLARTPTNRLITLTHAPDPSRTPEEILDRMNKAWRTAWKRIRREQGSKAVGYVRVVELTKAGTPHLHIAVRCAYISQAWLSATWNELTRNPIVDIRAVKSESGMAAYLAKYLTKTAAVLNNRRKWSASPRFVPPTETPTPEPDEIPPTWTFRRGPAAEHWDALIRSGYVEIAGWLKPPSNPADEWRIET